MAKQLLFNVIRFVALIAMQVFLFKNMGYYNLAVAFPYVLFIMLLPLGISNLSLYIIAFLTGITVDAFYDTPGLHAAACTALAWARTIFIRLTMEADNHEKMATPLLGEVSFRWFFPYVWVLTLIHHCVLFVLETFSFIQLHYTLISIVLSCIFTVITILLFSLLFYQKKQR